MVGVGAMGTVELAPGVGEVVVEVTVCGTVVAVATTGGPDGFGHEKTVCVGARSDVVTGTVEVVVEVVADIVDDDIVVSAGTMVAIVGPVRFRGNTPETTRATQSVPGRYKRT